MIWQLTIAVGVILALQQPQARIGEIDFFGTDGVNVQKLQSALPVKKGEEVTEQQTSELRKRISRAVETVLGHKPTDVAMFCCDARGDLMVYIGLGGDNTAVTPFAPAPKGSRCLQQYAKHLYEAEEEATAEAVRKGDTAEDDSAGYALSHDPVARAPELAAHEYAMTHEQSIERTLQLCGKPKDRQAAAWVLGYASRSRRQIASLVRASRDVDEDVRNNAVRALFTLARSSSEAASSIPSDTFIEMLNSGVWTDRNKAGFLLQALSSNRNPELLEQLRSRAIRSLVEMAKWQDPGHAYPYRVLLGRIAGLEETRIQQLIETGRVDEIIAAIGAA
jgi:hypothetical protein